MSKIRGQIRQHSVALISLSIALFSLAYNTWRNEQTEANRNVRTAGIEMLLKLGELEQVVFFSHYEMDKNRGNPRAGWAYLLTIRDLATLTKRSVMDSAADLEDAWGDNWDRLGKAEAANERISASIDKLRSDMLLTLAELE